MKKNYLLVVILVCAYALPGSAQSLKNTIPVIPSPRHVTKLEGSYQLPEKLKVAAKSHAELRIASLIQRWLQDYGREVSIVGSSRADIVLSSQDASVSHKEGYALKVNAKGIKINASTGAGLFYGLQTLIQLLPVDKESGAIPQVEISDEPEFSWRGSMLDVSRHFFSVDFIKKYIDFLATYKINTFHWHLTDDQGWRIEIKKYPKLTEVSAFRRETLIGEEQLIRKAGGNYVYDGIPYGGFYTQEEIKDIVAYAQQRHITIVPEIEMPGHTLSVLAAYPGLACKPGDYEVYTTWGVSEDIICPSEESFQFFENVLAEVVTLFPGEYIHIGGDEAPKTVWEESAEVHKIMEENGIEEVEKVQGWFNARIEKFLQSKGKKLIGWDEILEGGISPNATVMSWRGEEGGIEAAKHGNDVVMAPHDYVYLDYGQNPEPHSPHEPIMICCYLPIEKIYSYNPLPEELSPELHKHIIGVQANLWTEYITTPAKVEYALFPRLLALAEIAWTPAEEKNFEGFLNRVSHQFARLDEKEINYRIPEPEGLTEAEVKRKDGKAIITLSSLVPGARIHYTLGGHMPNETSQIYREPIEIPVDRNIKVRAITIAPNKRESVPVELIISDNNEEM